MRVLLCQIKFMVIRLSKMSLCFLLIVSAACTESFDISEEITEDLLVVNSTLTNKIEKQQIILSRTIGLNEIDPVFESEAKVFVRENNLKDLNFNEVSEGVYESEEEFGISADSEYQLFISTSEGMEYKSNIVTTPPIAAIDKVEAKKIINENGEVGVGIFVSTSDSGSQAEYYRFSFEETYRINAPLWKAVDVVANVSSSNVIFNTVERPASKQTCYKTLNSQSINIVSTLGLNENKIEDLKVNFISSDDIRMLDRYTILVKQYVQTQESYAFYKTLENFSNSEDIFTQVQPGFIRGNIVSITNPNEKVLGFFDVSTISEARIFFNREDFLEDGLPQYIYNCKEFIPQRQILETTEEFRSRVAIIINSNDFRILSIGNLPIYEGDPSIVLVPRECGDCSKLGNEEAPDFWIDE